MDTKVESGNRKGRPNYSREFKYQLALTACTPGVSVSRLAYDHGINMLFKWSRDLRAGLLTGTSTKNPELLPVVTQPSPPAKRENSASYAGMIEIAIADATVRVGVDTDAVLLRLVLQSLRA